MKPSRPLACANALIVAGIVVPVVVFTVPLQIGGSGSSLFSRAVVYALMLSPAFALGGTAWSGWLALREQRPRDFSSRALFTLGLLMCVGEVVAVFTLPIFGV